MALQIRTNASTNLEDVLKQRTDVGFFVFVYEDTITGLRKTLILTEERFSEITDDVTIFNSFNFKIEESYNEFTVSIQPTVGEVYTEPFHCYSEALDYVVNQILEPSYEA